MKWSSLQRYLLPQKTVEWCLSATPPSCTKGVCGVQHQGDGGLGEMIQFRRFGANTTAGVGGGQGPGEIIWRSLHQKRCLLQI